MQTFLSPNTKLDKIAQTCPASMVGGIYSDQIDIEFLLDMSFFSERKEVFNDRVEPKAIDPKKHSTI